jgi:hypothetical protein
MSLIADMVTCRKRWEKGKSVRIVKETQRLLLTFCQQEMAGVGQDDLYKSIRDIAYNLNRRDALNTLDYILAGFTSSHVGRREITRAMRHCGEADGSIRVFLTNGQYYSKNV